MAAPYEGMYAKLKFPPFKFQEYPKIVRDHAGTPTQVHSRTEELEHFARLNEKAPSEITEGLASERDSLAEENAKKDARIKELEELVAKTKQEAAVKVAALTPKGEAKASGTSTFPPGASIKPMGTPVADEK